MKYVKMKPDKDGCSFIHEDITNNIWKSSMPVKAILVYIYLVIRASNNEVLSLSQIAKTLNTAVPNIMRAIKQLQARNMIEVIKSPSKTNQYTFPHPNHWRRS